MENGDIYMIEGWTKFTLQGVRQFTIYQIYIYNAWYSS